MKRVTFYTLADGDYQLAGEVRLSDGTLEITTEGLRRTLEQIPVRVDGRYRWPSDGDKAKYLELLPYAFCGSYFRASLVEEV